MRKLTVVVVLALAAGNASADVKKISILRDDAMRLCGGEPPCGMCDDKDCKHGDAIVCPAKGDFCTEVSWIGTPPKHMKLISKIPITDLHQAVAPQHKMPGGGILDARPGLGGNGPAAPGAAAPSGPVLK